MKLSEIVNLIKIKEYVSDAVGLFSIEKQTIRELNDTLILIDKKIIELVTSKEFKEYIDYDHVKEAKQEVLRISNSAFNETIGRK